MTVAAAVSVPVAESESEADQILAAAVVVVEVSAVVAFVVVVHVSHPCLPLSGLPVPGVCSWGRRPPGLGVSSVVVVVLAVAFVGVLEVSVVVAY